MKLYDSPGTCSLSALIAINKSGLVFETIANPTKARNLADRTDYCNITPPGYVALLELAPFAHLGGRAVVTATMADGGLIKAAAWYPLDTKHRSHEDSF